MHLNIVHVASLSNKTGFGIALVNLWHISFNAPFDPDQDYSFHISSGFILKYAYLNEIGQGLQI